jgi:adenine-specific DNA-methyltransferase
MTDVPERVRVASSSMSAAVLETLQELIPGAIVDGVLDAQRIADLVGLEVTSTKKSTERFGLMWAGKGRAVESLQASSMASLQPEMKESISWDNAENVFIEGDNLEVLKLLQKAYNDQVKLIYIDPPYNTGKDFVYNDDFSDPLKHYLEVTGQVDSEGNRLVANTEVSGRKHSNWLSMMYPRLVLARNLLTDEGFIFVSISDIEVANLRKIMDEIFGEENFVETFIWESIFRPSNLSKTVRKNAEYVVCYARNASRDFTMIERFQAPQGEASLTQNNNRQRTLKFPGGTVKVGLPSGTYKAQKVGNIELLDDLVVKGNIAISEFRISGNFKWSQEYLNEEIIKGVTLMIKSESLIPYYRKDYQETALTPTKIIPNDVVKDVLAAGAELKDLLGEAYFPYPKPTSLIEFVIRIAGVGDDDIVLDFFAGSGTTGHAVLKNNVENKLHNRFVLVNLPEKTAEGSLARNAGINTVSEITRMRLTKVFELLPTAKSQGFRCLTLGPSSFIDTTPVEGQLFAETLNPQSDNDAITAEVLLKSGVRLDMAWKRMKLAGSPVVISDGVAVVLARKVTNDVVAASLELSDVHTVIFLEDAFSGEDSVKANAHFAFKNANKTMKSM